MSISIHLEVTFAICQYIVDSSVAECCLQFDIFFCQFGNLFCFLDNTVQDPLHLLSSMVVFGIFVGLPCTHLSPSSSLVRRIWSLVVPVHSSESVSLHQCISMGSGMFHHLSRKASNELLHEVEKYIFYSWTTNLLCCFPFCRLLRFQHHLFGQGFCLLSMTALFAISFYE